MSARAIRWLALIAVSFVVALGLLLWSEHGLAVLVAGFGAMCA